MSHLEKLTLYVCPYQRPAFVDGTHLHKEILSYMRRLHTFTVYTGTQIEFDDSVHRLSDNDIQRTFRNIGYHQ
jgi:hypothetical protein